MPSRICARCADFKKREFHKGIVKPTGALCKTLSFIID